MRIRETNGRKIESTYKLFQVVVLVVVVVVVVVAVDSSGYDVVVLIIENTKFDVLISLRLTNTLLFLAQL